MSIQEQVHEKYNHQLELSWCKTEVTTHVIDHEMLLSRGMMNFESSEQKSPHMHHVHPCSKDG